MRALFLAGLLLAASAARAAPAAAPPEAKAHKEIGDQRRKAGDAAGALESYRTALEKFGGYAEAYEAVGEVQYGQKKFAEAIEAFGFAVEIDPAYALAWYNMAFAARKASDLPRARGAYERYVKLRPADADGHYGLAETLRGLGERDAAASEYQLFVDLATAVPAQAEWVEKARGFLAQLRTPQPAPPTPPTPISTSAPAASPDAPSVAPEARSRGAPPPISTSAPAAFPDAPSVAPEARSRGAPTTAPPPISTSAPAASPDAPSVAPEARSRGAPTPISTSAPAASPDAPSVAPEARSRGAPPPVAVVPTAPALPPQPVRPPEAPPSQALIDKLGAADRAYLAGDFRAAHFLYQDATYLDPGSAAAKLRLARTYAALRYPEKAEAQLKQVLELDPANAEARKQLEELKNPPPRAAPIPAAIVPPAPASGGPGLAAATGTSGSRAYKFTPEAEPPQAAPPPAPTAPPVEAAGPTAADLYRTGVAQIGRREFAMAVDSFSRALERSPDLVVAYEARASARFGLGQHREAAQDYQTAFTANPSRASPLWGLGECYRMLGDRRAIDAYEQYAESSTPDVTERQRDVARKRARELRDR